MLSFFSRHICAVVISICLVGMPFVQTANAAIISTDTAIELSERQDRIDHIHKMLAADSVHKTLVRMGVDPSAANTRVSALTDVELQTLEQQLDQLPAGGTGVVEVVGIVAIVLIVLELLNVTNFFNEF